MKRSCLAETQRTMKIAEASCLGGQAGSLPYFRTKLLIIIFIVIALILPVSGCKEKAPPPPKKKTEVKKEAEVKPEVLTQEAITKSKGYMYEPAGRRDPFQPLIVMKRQKKVDERVKRPPGTLESYDIGDFSLLAVVKKGHKYYALLLAPDNRSFTVNEGDTIGLYNGKIEKITDRRVIIVEYTEDYKGDKKPREVVLKLHKED